MLDEHNNIKIIDFGDANYIVKPATEEEDLPLGSQ
jgi:serine/threonine protein kinase